MDRSPCRRGVTLPITAILLLLASIGAVMLQHASRQRYREAHRHTSASVAEALAESGLNATLEQIWVGVQSPGSVFHDLVKETPAADLDGLATVVDSPHLGAVVAPLDDASLEVTVTFQEVRPFYPEDGLGGIRRDPREKFGQLVVGSTGTYRGIARRYEVVKPFKVVDVSAPVVSKFTLFVREHGDTPVNCLGYDRLNPGAAMDHEGRPGRPLTLFHRPGAVPTVEADTFHPTAPLIDGVPVDEGGLVYLGGEPWYLNLVHGSGAGPFDELHHLRRVRMLAPTTIAGGEGAMDGRLWFGFYSGVLEAPPLQAGVAARRVPRRPSGEEVTDLTSALHLYGDVFNVSPTPVLGPVYRSYLLVPLPSGLWLPYLTQGEYSSLGRPPVLSPYTTYAEHMTRVVEDPYNRSYDFLRTNMEALEPGGRVRTVGDQPMVPSMGLVPDALNRLGPASDGDRHFLYPPSGDPAPGLCRLRRPMASGEEEVFRGALADLTPELLARALTSKAVETVADQAEFDARFGVGPLDLPGIVLVESGGLRLGQRGVLSAGMVLARGDIEVTGFLSQQEAGATLTLVSLEGNVTVSTGDLVQAHLVALGGTAYFSRGQLNILGGVAAGRLDLPSLVAGVDAKWLTYDPGLDPTSEESYRRHLRFFMAENHGLRIQAE